MQELDCCASVNRRLMLNASKMGVIHLAAATRAGIVRESLSKCLRQVEQRMKEARRSIWWLWLILCFLSKGQRGVAPEYVSACKTPVRILKRMDFRCDTILENGNTVVS
jgi:hypothetical protein